MVEVVAQDFAFVMPDTLRGGMTTFHLRNEGRQPHHLMLYRLEPGKSLGDVYRALEAGGSHPGWMHAVGGPNAVPHGGESVGTVVLEPGRYVAFCHVKSPDQKIHLEKGMLKALTVTPPAGPAAAWPPADLTVTLREYTFTWSRPPTRGWHRIAVRNLGRQRHEIILSRLAAGKTSQDFVRWMNAQQGPPPVVGWAGPPTCLPAAPCSWTSTSSPASTAPSAACATPGTAARTTSTGCTASSACGSEGSTAAPHNEDTQEELDARCAEHYCFSVFAWATS